MHIWIIFQCTNNGLTVVKCRYDRSLLSSKDLATNGGRVTGMAVGRIAPVRDPAHGTCSVGDKLVQKLPLVLAGVGQSGLQKLHGNLLLQSFISRSIDGRNVPRVQHHERVDYTIVLIGTVFGQDGKKCVKSMLPYGQILGRVERVSVPSHCVRPL